MLAPAQTEAAPIMTLPPAGNGYSSLDSSPGGQRQFKKHKVLPRPQNDRAQDSPRRRPKNYDLVLDTSSAPPANAGSQPTSPRTLKHQPKRIGTGPDLPPTPPTHSRTSSSSHSGRPSSPTNVEKPQDTTPKTALRHPPVTPPDQRSPPTPDVTPPQPASRPRALRLLPTDRGTSRTTPGDSRTDSFKTAREEPLSSEDEDGKSTVKPAIASSSTSQTSVRRVPDKHSHNNRIPQPQALGLALAQLSIAPEEQYTPRTKGEFGKFDGDWGTLSDVEQEWDDNLQRSVTVKKTRPDSETPRVNGYKADILEDNVVTPTDATKAARNMSLRDKDVPTSPPKSTSGRRNGPSTGPSNSGTSVATAESRRLSGASGRSSASTVVEAILVDGPPPPRRQKTLRHVQKQSGLRASLYATPESRTNSSGVDRPARQPRSDPRREDGRQESYASHTSANGVSSGRARREVWKNGGIPVIVVPERGSSSKSRSSREPSLRSTSSRRSKRTMSLGSGAVDGPTNKDFAPISGQHPRRSRALSESDSSDQRTIDYPPVVPARSSSLSAPTSRNTSRANSMTAESVKARNGLQIQSAAPITPDTRAFEVQPNSDAAETTEPVPQLRRRDVAPLDQDPLLSPVVPTPPEREDANQRFSGLGVDHHDDAHSSKRYTARNTPFSAASLETNGTVPELSEATAVHMYPHQNSSVLMVNHAAGLSEASDPMEQAKDTPKEVAQPKITTTGPDGEVPVTPPQPRFSVDDVDSPLRNPRAPPEPPTHPPAINFIPATPSGLTPAHDKEVQLGNYFEATAEKPPRRPSMVRQALGRRRHSIQYPPTASKPPGFLTRTFSLSRNVSKIPSRSSRGMTKPDMEGSSAYPQAEDPPAEENKLHPYWRPQRFDDDEYDDDYAHDDVYRYPPVDNRPRMPKRSLSARMKNTFAIMPTRDSYLATDGGEGPERRTIRRTGSGSLRVVRRRVSTESLRRVRGQHGRPYTAPDGEAGRAFWRGNSVHRRVSKERQRRFSLGGTLEEIQNIPRRLSERRREKRTQELRQKISGPREVRDGVGEVVRSGSRRHYYGANGHV